MQQQPLILTLQLDPQTFTLLNELRKAHFPPERNIVPAHVTLFHALPGAEEELISAQLAALAASTTTLPLAFPALRFLGRGVALEVTSPALLLLRQQLAQGWAAWLSPQDCQPYRPHVTLQNKVSSEQARRLHDELSASWQGLAGHAQGLILWRYLGGPWEQAAGFRFAEADPGEF